jgi:crotonobetaine/carnitine-CoA ligase
VNRLTFDDIDDRLLGRCLRRQAEKIPDRDFLVEDTTHLSYGQINAWANASARGFQELGVAAGDTVTYLMGSCSEYVWSTLGLNKMGAVWVPTNVDYKGTWLRESLEDSRAKVLVADAGLLPRVAELGPISFEHVVVRGDMAGVPDLGCPLVPIEQLQQAPGGEPDAELFYGDTASILWTSGTTGRSKGVMQSHNVWIRAALNGAENSGLRDDEVIYNCLPMYQSAAWVANIYRALVCGVPCAMDPQFSASDFWNRTRHYGATMVFTLGAMHMFLWNAPPREDDADNPVRVGGMVPMPENIIGPFKERFGMEEIHQGYGQSEVMSLMGRQPGVAYKPNSLGTPADGIEVHLLDDHDFEVPVGEVGEFCIRPIEPYTIFNGYFHNPEATVKAWSNLWYHTGDLGRRDEDGEFFFVDRKQDFIRFKGRNISSFAVEASVGAHPDVMQCAAHGVTSEQLAAEAEMKVCIVRKEGATVTEEEIARFVNDTAPYFFVPRYIEFVPSLPQTPTGRVQKFKLRELGVTAETWDGQAEGFEVRR